MLLAKPLRRPPREIAARLAALADRGRRPGRARGGRGPGLREPLARDRTLAGAARRALLRRPRRVSAAASSARRPARAGRVRVGEPDRTAHARPRPPGGARRLRSRACSSAAGHDVTREYYFNNGGRQMRMLGESVRRATSSCSAARAAAARGVADATTRCPGRSRSAACPSCSRGRLPGRLHPRARRRAPRRARRRRSSTSPATGSSARPPRRTIFGEIRKTLAALGIDFDVYFNECDSTRRASSTASLADLERAGPGLRDRTARAGCARPRSGSSATAWS